MVSLLFIRSMVAVMVVTLIVLQSFASATELRSIYKRSTRSRSSSSHSSSRGTNRGRGLGSNAVPGSSTASQTRRQNQERSHYMACPVVHCQEVSSDCQIIEYMVYEYQYEERGKGLVTVRCQSCDYCLDPRHLLTSRDIHTYGTQQKTAMQTTPCSRAHCPFLNDTCIDVRVADVLVNGQKCGQCPICYDPNVVNIL